MAKARIITTDEEIDAALEQAKLLEDEVLARSVEYVASHNVLVLTLTNARRLLLPVEDLQGLQNATPTQLAQAEILRPGSSLHFEELDADFYVPSLIKGIYGNQRWMQQLDARKPQAA